MIQLFKIIMKRNVMATIFLCIISSYGIAQLPKFEWRLENERLTSPTTYQLDVFLYNLDTFDFEVRGGTIAFYTDPNWRNGGTITVSHLSSELKINQQGLVSLYTNQLGALPEYWRKIILSVGAGEGTTIPAKSRIKCYTILLSNTVSFSTTIPPKFAWRFGSTPGAGFNITSIVTQNLIACVDYYGPSASTLEARANQIYCYTPAYWNGTQWRTKSTITGSDTNVTLSIKKEVNIYSGVFSGSLNVRGYVLMPSASHNISSGNILTVRADLGNYGYLNSIDGNTEFRGNEIAGTGRIQNIATELITAKFSQYNPYHVALGGNTTVYNQLKFTKGNIILNNNNLTIGNSANITGESDSGYVVSNLAGKLIINNIGAKGKSVPIIFPVGTTTDYNPLTLKNECIVDNFSVSVSKGVYNSNGILTSDVVDKTWNISEFTPGGSNLTITLQWNANDELTSFIRSSSHVSSKDITGKWYVSHANTVSGSGPFSQSISGFVNLSKYSYWGVSSNGMLQYGEIDTTNYVQLNNSIAPQNKSSKGNTNVVLYKIEIPFSCNPLNLSELKFMSSGTYNSYDISNFKLWYHRNPLFSVGNPILLDTKMSGLDTGLQYFSSINLPLASDSNYIFLTTDIPCTASNNKIIINFKDLSFTSGTAISIGLPSTVDIIPSHIIDSIVGDSFVYNNVSYKYSIIQQANITYTWVASNGVILNGQGTNTINVQWDSSGIGKLKLFGKNQFQCSDSITKTINIINNPNCIKLSNTGAPNINPAKGSTNVVLSRINIDVACIQTTLQTLSFVSAGTYKAADIDNYKIWFHNNGSFDIGSPILLSTQINNLDTGLHSFIGLNQTFPIGTNYIFITTDILCDASNKSLTINPLSLKNIAFSTGEASGSVFTASTITFSPINFVDSIVGNTVNVYSFTTNTYKVPLLPNINYQWIVTNGNIISGQGTNEISIEWINIGLGVIKILAQNKQLCNDTCSLKINILNNPNCILISNDIAPQSNPLNGAKNVIIYRVDINVKCSNPILNSLQFITLGNYTSTDISNFKIWYHDNSNFAVGSPLLLATKITGLNPGLQKFNSLSQSLQNGLNYIFITTDISCNANTKNLIVKAMNTTDVIFVSNTFTGSIFTQSTINLNSVPQVDNIVGQTIDVNSNVTYTYKVTQQLNINYNWTISNGMIVNGQGTNEVSVLWFDGISGKLSVDATNQYACVKSKEIQVSILNFYPIINLANGLPTQMIPSKGAINNVIYRIDIIVSKYPTSLKSLQFTTSGTYTDFDINNMKVWYHTNSSFTTGTPILLSTKTVDLGGGLQQFPDLTQTLSVDTHYIFITIDIPCKATNKVIVVNPISVDDLTFESGYVSGTDFTTKPVTINPLPIVANITGQTLNVKANLTYTYNVTQQANISYEWKAINGEILSGQGTNSVSIKWIKEGVGKISLVGINQFQCVDSTNVDASIIHDNSGINDLFNSSRITVFPNPNHGIFTIRINAIKNSETKISIYNLLGQEVWSDTQIVKLGEQDINIVSNLSEGIFILRIQNENEYFTKQVVVH